MSGKNVVETFREVVQDLLVPELKAVKISVEALNNRVDTLRDELKEFNATSREELKESSAALREEIRQSNAALREEMRLRMENLERTIQYGDSHNEQLLRMLADKLDSSAEIRERLANLEGRLPRQ